MPTKGNLTLADVAASTDMLAVACSRCDSGSAVVTLLWDILDRQGLSAATSAALH
jgi:hypothetical protein